MNINIQPVIAAQPSNMEKKNIICLIGNHGCGKSSICQMINSRSDAHHPNIIAIESGDGLNINYSIDPSSVDQLKLEYAFDTENFNKVIMPDQAIDFEQVYWIILDCESDAILKRIESRPVRNIFETRKALNYFQQRFRHLGTHFGIPLVNTTTQTLEQVYDEVLDIIRKHSNYYQYYRQMGTQTLSYSHIQEWDLENRLYQMMTNYDITEITDLPEYAHEPINIDQRRLYVRWYIRHNSLSIDQQKKMLSVGEYQLSITGPILQLVTEGESKKVYKDVSGNPFTQSLAIIILKSTIYSHTNQATGEISNLGSIRARGSQLIMEMMWRNGLKHSYRSINSNGIIVSDFIEEIPPIEVIIKRYCQGTDKRSYYDILEDENIVIPNSNGEYVCGPYVRLDWRNPNHISPQTGKCLNKNPYYYIYEQAYGKEKFFDAILANKQYAVAVGDRNITEELLTHVLDVKQTKVQSLKLFMVIQSYLSRVNLLIKDVCFMLDKNGDKFWSEVNQDCMRITAIDSEQNKFDKDIWRAGGQSSREQVLKKWSALNGILIDYFMKNKFHETEMLCYDQSFYMDEIQQLLSNSKYRIPISLQELWLTIRGKTPRNVLVTMDMFNGQPVLVKSSKVHEIHSDGDYEKAMKILSIFPDMLVVDLDGAFGDVDTKNRRIIKILAQKHHVYSGGGLRTLEDVEDLLKSSVRRCVIASADDELIKKVPKERLVVELSINEQNEVLIHGRKTNTHMNAIERIHQLIDIGVYIISITFVHSEGHLSGIPRQQIRDLLLQIPYYIKRIYIAGGISTLEDLEYLWSFDRVVPQLGSAIWKNKLTIGSIFNSMINFNHDGTVSAIIQDINGPVKGLCYMNRESIEQTCQHRQLYRYSRKLRRVIMKGETSGDIQNIIQISLDCDSDAILILVDSKRPFCHRGHHSCFCIQTSIKANLATLADHIKSKINENSYSGVMQRNPQLALAKVMEEFWEVLASNQDNQVAECSDLFIHFVMYLNGIGVSMENIFNELNARRWAPKGFTSQNEICDIKSKEIIIGITTTKYTEKTDRFAEEELGIKIVRQSGRNLRVRGEIIDRNKFHRYFGDDDNIKISLFASKPKDMPWLLASKRVTHLITFETVVKNYPNVYTAVHEVVDPTVCLALLCRKGACIEPEKWSRKNKPLIASEHVNQVTRFFEQSNIDPTTYHLDRVTGSSEGYLVNTDLYLLADAIVESGRTVDENNLEIWKTIIPRGELHIALYGRCT